MGIERPIYIELGNGYFVNAYQVTQIGAVDTGGYGNPNWEVRIWLPWDTHGGSRGQTFHPDRIQGEQAARAACLAILAELGRAPEDNDRLRVITYLNGSVQARYL